MLTFHLEIQIGYETMDTARDVADALRRVSERIAEEDRIPVSREVRDYNGHTVGKLWVLDHGNNR